MKTNVAVYKNELNAVPFRKFTSIEMDLFFSICSQMRDKGIMRIRYSFEDLKELSHYSSTSKERFINDLEKTYDKLMQLSYRYEDTKQIRKFILFTTFVIDKEFEYVEIAVNSDLEYILNEITGQFTKFELEEFTNLNSSYSKTAFRLLKQFRLTGFWKIKIDHFRELLDIPKNYTISAIDKRVLTPINKELSLIFKNLNIKKIKAKKQNKIEYLEFSFTPQDDIRKNGTKTFKDKNRGYYENDIEHFTREEINKSFPTK